MAALLYALLLLLLPLCPLTESQNSYFNCGSDTKYPLHLVGFFPCLDNEDATHSSGCRLPLAAVEHAITLVNRDDDLLRCFRIELFPITVQDPQQHPTELIEFLYNQYNDQPIHGAIGPYHADSAKMFAYVFGLYLSTLQISYSVTNTLLEDTMRYPYFHATVPTDAFMSKVLTALLEHFGWQEVAILSTHDEQSVLASQTVARELALINGDLSHFLGAYIGSATEIIKTAKAIDIRIFVAIIKSESARSFMCQAYRANLTTPQHVWILPGIYNPLWWELENLNETVYNCTNNQIKEAISSMLFYDSTPTIIPKNEEDDIIISTILNRTTILNGTLNYIDFHYLLHSKLLNAYDATRAMALAWNATLQDFTDNELSILFNQSWKNSSQSKQKLVEALQYNLKNAVSPYTGLADTYNFNNSRNQFGGAIITQFVGNGECILGYYSSINSSHVTRLEGCQHDYCCNATWKGGYKPTDGHCPNGSCTCRENANTINFVLLSLLLFSGIFFSILMQFVNYRFRENKYFKSSSPVLNALITFGCTMGYVTGLLFLASYYVGITGKGELTPVCNVTISSFWLSLVIVNSTIFMKNWRIFRIFHNPTQKERNNLSNKTMFLGILILCSPVLLMLIIIVSAGVFSKYESTFDNFQCPNIPEAIDTMLIEDHCIERLAFKWDILISVFIFFLFISITMLGSYNSRLSSHYKKEGELAILTGIISLVLFTSYYLIAIGISSGYTTSSRIENHMPYTVGSLWIYNSFILTVLYLSKAIEMLRNRKFRPRLRSRKTTIRKKFNDLHDQLFILKHRLQKIDESIAIEQMHSTDSTSTEIVTVD